MTYEPNNALRDLMRNLEIQHNELPDENLHRVRYPTESKIVDTGFRFEENTLTHTTLVDKLPEESLPNYTYVASQTPTRGMTIVTQPNKGYVGVQGTEILPPTKVAFEEMILDTLSNTANFVDNIHPLITKIALSKK